MYKVIHTTRYIKNTVKERILFFGQNSGLHGCRHVFKENAYIVYRLFWILILLASAWCLYLLLVPVMERGDEIGFGLDTRYLTWTTTFPAVTVCEIYHHRTAEKKLVERYPNQTKTLNSDYKKHLSAIVYGRYNNNIRKLEQTCGGVIPCDLPWRDMANNIRLQCSEMLSDCSYNNVEFGCCDKFHIVDSEYGPCVSFNTLQNVKAGVDDLYTVNITTGPGVLQFRLLSNAEVSVHSPEELSTNQLSIKYKFEVMLYLANRVEYLFSLVETENDPMLQSEDLATRRCRFLTELPKDPLYVYPVYSFGTCYLVHETNHLFEHCGCVHPIRDIFYKNKFCNYTGLNCISLVQEHEKLKADKDKNTMTLDCLPSCDEIEVTSIHLTRNWVLEEPQKGTLVTIRMASLPTIRFQRNLLRTGLDLVVSVGGMVGLFFSASILTVVEIFYLFFRNSR
ncbi:acid-sensing ion channel 1-like [Galleria mellonella]|uniref:Acid-sensing ion channel 1-like n=1 Tax=Galleria mellonella TaxID=7137 RepID=A0A6J3CD42_GALME|nr:acid-sensing ion channel 1-like [Galleria mellonella]